MEVVSDVVKFRANVPERFMLAFDSPKQVTSNFGGEDQYLVTSQDGRRAFVTPYCASKLALSGARKNDLVEIIKTFRKEGQRQVPDWVVRIVQEDKEPEPAQPRAIAAPATSSPAPTPQTASSVSRPATIIDDALMTTIAACQRAEQYSTSIGWPIKFDKDDVRTFATTLLIGHQKREGASR